MKPNEIKGDIEFIAVDDETIEELVDEGQNDNPDD